MCGKRENVSRGWDSADTDRHRAAANRLSSVRDVLTTLGMTVLFVWGLTLWNRFVETYRLHLQGWSMCFHHSPYKFTRRHDPEEQPPWEPQTSHTAMNCLFSVSTKGRKKGVKQTPCIIQQTKIDWNPSDCWTFLHADGRTSGRDGTRKWG
jgi:hypothetical protein